MAMAITRNNYVFKGHKTLLGSKFVTYGEVNFQQGMIFFLNQTVDLTGVMQAQPQNSWLFLCFIRLAMKI